MSDKVNKTMTVVLRVRVFGYKMDDGRWAAHCLETDLVGYGKTPTTSLGNLVELTQMQVSFALFKKDPTLLDRPAPPHILENYYNLQREGIQRLVSKKKRRDKSHLITTIPLLPPSSKTEFHIAQA